MITISNFEDLLKILRFEEQNNVYSKDFPSDFALKVDFNSKEIIYPEDKGLIVNERQTCNFCAHENFVVFECVHRLLEKGYKPEHIELEPKWKVGHGASGGRADILVKNQDNIPILIIECKTAGKEFEKAWKNTHIDGGQLFSYVQQQKSVKFICLYASDFVNPKVDFEYCLLTISDNQNEVEKDQNKEIKRLFFKDAQDVKQLFQVWKETYGGDFRTHGIFEKDVAAYNIGKEKITLSDLKYIGGKEMQGKFNEFADILRKYNVSSKEGAFDKLINLFLCKIVDETQSIANGKELNFYWRGKYADDFFSLIDRLQKLYAEGMREYLGEKITFIENDAVRNAFGFYKDRNATLNYVLKLFKEQKYFTNSDFGFIEVHNDKLFYQNAQILLDVIRMWQDFQLNGEQQNQFLGDMFEGFLDKGFKQSEGQFFTPIPICKFILSALPLENILNESEKPPRVIDYACGSGHFLTEYASQITPFIASHNAALENVEHHKNLKNYYKNIFGVEKEYRLSKVAKISAFMYGQDEINVIYCDALRNIQQEIKGKIVLVEEESCDILVANPPFAVDGFLTTLSQAERDNFTLFTKNIELEKQRNIQCFFLERAKQLLAPNGVAGIIVPSSVLSNSDDLHVQTREILLKFFDLVSIVELGSGTFGKTGTNTVVLFLRRKAERPEPSEHFWFRTQNFFDKWDEEIRTNGGCYNDLYYVKNYCRHIEIPFDEYQTLLLGKPSDALFNAEIFKDYRKDFDESNDTKTIKRSRQFRVKTETEQKIELDKQFLEYCRKIEMDKLYYFILAFSNPQEVLIVKSPTDNSELKKFLGYEWSSAKGSEGIKYLGGEKVNDIITPLFDPNNPQNPDKISYLIQQNFLSSQDFENSPPFQGGAGVVSLISYAPLTDLLDFSRKDFNKTFSLTPKKNTAVESKWDLVKLGNYVETLNGLWTGKKTPFVSVTVIRNTNFKVGGKLDLSDVAVLDVEVNQYEKRKLQYGDIIIEKSGGSSTQAVGRVIFFDKTEGEYSYSNFTSRIRLISKDFSPKYLHIFLNYFYESGYTFEFQSGMSGIKNLDFERYLSIKIPLPPLSVQEQIVAECEAIDQAVSEAQNALAQANEDKEELISGVFGQYLERKISEIALVNPSKTEIRNTDENMIVSFVEMASVSDKGFIAQKIDRPLKDLKKSSYTYFAENDIIIAKITPCMENGKCALAKGLTNGLAMGSSEFHVFRTKSEVLSQYLFALLNREEIRKEAEQNMTGSSGHRRVPAKFYENIKIPVPPLSEQEKLVAEIEKLEEIVVLSQKIISEAGSQKQAILKKYL